MSDKPAISAISNHYEDFSKSKLKRPTGRESPSAIAV
jgi:hypothetical protein